jgi:hypothetical protein
MWKKFFNLSVPIVTSALVVAVVSLTLVHIQQAAFDSDGGIIHSSNQQQACLP